ncbi:MAG: TonB-dependent receptor [Bacteroidales bacterium]
MKRQIYSLLLVIILIVPGTGWTLASFSQTLTIRDRETGRPLEAVSLFSEHPKAYAITNAEGQVKISAFRGSDQIQIRSMGYKTLSTSYSALEGAGFEILLEVSSLNLDEVVVSATRWRQVSSNVPSKVISIPKQEVALQKPQTAADLLGISGKVFIQKSQQGGGSPMIRGFATNRLIYTVDGVRMNTAIFRGGNLQNVINLDPFATENTEVLFGPGSVIYGSDAIGGVMGFQTLTPQLTLSGKPLITGKAVARYASANHERTGHFDVNVGWKKWALVTSFSSWDFDHLKQGSHGPEDYIKGYYVQRQDNMDVVISQDDPLLQIPSAYSQINLMQKVLYQPGEHLEFRYGFHYSETSPYGRYDRHNRVRAGMPRYAEWNYGPQKWMMNQLSVSHTRENVAYDRLMLRLAWQSFEESRIARALNDPERTTQAEQVEAYSLNLDLVKSLGNRQTMFYGIEFILDDVSSRGTLTDIISGISQNGPSRYPLSTWKSLAVYFNDEYRISDQFTLQAGLRYNQFVLDADFTNNLEYYPFPFSVAAIRDGALTGSIGGVWLPAETWVIKGNFGTAFRAPNVDDIGKVFDSEPGSVTVPNPDLDAEYAYNLDVGAAKVLGGIAKLDLTGYYTLLNNAMVRRDGQLSGQDSIMYDGMMSRVQTVQNAAVAHVFGVQAGLEIKLPAGFGFSSDLNVQKGMEELDDGSVSPSRHAAPLFGISRLHYRTERLVLELYAVYQGEKSHDQMPEEEKGKVEIYAKDAEGNTYAPAWATLNIEAMVELTEIFSVSAGIENLTDRRYRPYSSGISGAGRSFVISLTAKF